MSRSPRIAALLLAAVMFAAPAASAHDFWIAPQRGTLEPGEPLHADLMVGVMLKGEPYPYLSDSFTAFTVTADGTTETVAGNEGDLPALALPAARPGLNVIAHQTIAFRVTYDDWQLFRTYLDDEGLTDVERLHRARGLPETGFAERYIRCAKALVQVGPVEVGGGGGAPAGMPFELLTGANPYAPGLAALPVTLLWHGEPLANHQIKIIRDDGAATRTTVITGPDGTALVPLAGGGRYLLNAVILEPVTAPPVVWQSHWASLTFVLPP